MNGTNTTQSAARHLDRALTVGGYVPGGRYKDSTAKLYADAWKDFSTWCRSAGRTPMPATPETIATYAVHLMDDGYTPGTVRSRITAVRARHRLLGHPVPDNVAAWSVLRSAEPTREPAVTKGVCRKDLIAAVEACDATIAGWRNRAIVLLAWHLAIPAPGLGALDIPDIHLPQHLDDSVTVTISGHSADLVIEHDHEPIATTAIPMSVRPDLCPACAVRHWINIMALAGIVDGPLWRSVDRLGVIEGSGISRAGAPSSSGSRLSKRSLYRVWASLVAKSGIEVSTLRALRIGGAQHRVQTAGRL